MKNQDIQSLIDYHNGKNKSEIIAGAIVGAALFCGLLCLMLAYFDVLTK